MPDASPLGDVSAFAHRAAHDLQAPLHRIRAFADILGEDAADERDRRGLEIVSRSARDASALVDRLLALTLATHRPLDRGDVDVRLAAERALGDLAAEIERTGAAIELRGLGRADADPELLTALCAELLANAIAFREPGRSPVVVLRMDGADGAGAGCLRVIDDGAGWPEGRREVLAEPFESGPDADGAVGTGLGLALCRIVCERHGWTLALGDADGGTEARVVFDRTATAAAEPTSRPRARPA